MRRDTPLIKDLPVTERPQQRLRNVGPAALSLRELLACMLQTPNALSQAQELMRCFGLHGLLKASTPELRKVPGIGPAKAVQLKAAFELGRRSTLDQQDDRYQITSPADAAGLLLHELDGLDQEHLVVISLDTNGHRRPAALFRRVYLDRPVPKAAADAPHPPRHLHDAAHGQIQSAWFLCLRGDHA